MEPFSHTDYYMPSEWSNQEGTWLSWPYNLETFGDLLPQVEQTYLEFIYQLTSCQQVFLVVPSPEIIPKLEIRFNTAKIPLKKVHFFPFHSQDVWFRDYGPIFVNLKKKKQTMLKHHKSDDKESDTDETRNEDNIPEQLILDWDYNAWGNKYSDLVSDTNIPNHIAKSLNIPIIQPNMVLEGGSIEVNGEGILLTTEQCLLNPNRNPNLSKANIEEKLRSYLGITDIWWLKEGIVGDDTDGHIDDIARFISPNSIVCCQETNPQDENYPILKENLEILQKISKINPDLKILTLPMPDPVIYEGIRLPASYANFYIANTKVLVPIFGQSKDQMALDILQKAIPDRKIIGINSKALVYGLGTLHCVSQQQPIKRRLK